VKEIRVAGLERLEGGCVPSVTLNQGKSALAVAKLWARPKLDPRVIGA
jgi:hypothetical protein